MKKTSSVTVRYDLPSLPSAQHKAGLAGLLVVIESMKRRRLEPVPEIVSVDEIGAELTFTEQSMQALMDDLFDAEIVEVKVKSRWPGKTKPKDIVEIEVVTHGQTKKEKRFVYDVMRPKGAFLQTFLSHDDSPWVQLWRDFLWNTLRAQPKTRGVYDQRAQGKASSESAKNFKCLREGASKKKAKSQKFAGSVYLGAQSVNAEGIDFTGAAAENFLLNFWTACSFIFVPRTFSVERSQDESKRVKWENRGFVVVVPEPEDLEDFVEEHMEMVGDLSGDKFGNRPRQAAIDLLEEGALEYLYHFAKAKFLQRVAAEDVLAFEVCHVEKKGNSVKLLSSSRMNLPMYLIGQYDKLRKSVFNPLFKRVVFKNLLQERDWHENAQEVFDAYPHELFAFQKGKTPPEYEFRFFGNDARKVFSNTRNKMKITEGGGEMNTSTPQDKLEIKVYDMVGRYVRAKAEEKSGQKYENFKKNEKGYAIYPKEYRDALEKACGDAFLSMRGRRDQDFVEYFTGTICSVPHYLPKEDYLLVSRALLEDWQKIKNLAMMAVSAHSYLPSEKKEKGEQS